MKYPYIVVKNGVWYSSGANVPEDFETNSIVNDFKYKKSDINRMSVADLKDLANMYNIPNAQSLVGADLKKILIEELGL